MDVHQSAWEAIRNGEFDQAQRIAAALAKQDPDDADAWYLLSEAVSGERAEIFLRKALALDPTVPERYWMEPKTLPPASPSLESMMASDLESASLPEEFFTYPDNRPEVDLAEEADEAAPAAPPPAAPRPGRRSSGLVTNALLLVIGVLIVIVLYFLITNLNLF